MKMKVNKYILFTYLLYYLLICLLIVFQRHLLLKKRHDVDDEFDEDLDNIEDDDVFKHSDKSILYIFTTVPGTLILISFVVFLFLFIAIDNVKY